METDLSDRPSLHPLIFLMLLVATLGVGFIVVGPLVGFLLSSPLYPGSLIDMAESLADPAAHPEMKIPLYLMQGFATLIGLIVGPALLMRTVQMRFSSVFDAKNWQPIGFAITFMIVIVFMGVNSLFVEWNANAHFPSFLQGFEDWARAKEDQAAVLTEFMTRLDNVGELVLALMVIAVLPAIGEELVFRGLIQKQLQNVTGNPHLAIAISAFLFSAIHMQFFGFVPRFFLGLLFGYLFLWSGNLTISIVAHFVNNGFAVLGMYFYQRGVHEFDMESTDSMPLSTVGISAVLTAMLLYYFYKIYHQHTEASRE